MQSKEFALPGVVCPVMALPSGQAEGTPQDILGQPLEGRRVVSREVDTIIDTETGVRPSAHLVNCLLVDLAGDQQELEDFRLPRGQ